MLFLVQHIKDEIHKHERHKNFRKIHNALYMLYVFSSNQLFRHGIIRQVVQVIFDDVLWKNTSQSIF